MTPINIVIPSGALVTLRLTQKPAQDGVPAYWSFDTYIEGEIQ